MLLTTILQCWYWQVGSETAMQRQSQLQRVRAIVFFSKVAAGGDLVHMQAILLLWRSTAGAVADASRCRRLMDEALISRGITEGTLLLWVTLQCWRKTLVMHRHDKA